MSKQQDDDWLRKNFPTVHARDAADKAIDKIDVDQPMHVFLDTWVATYLAAGGRTTYDPKNW